jgi:hypothetical protein
VIPVANPAIIWPPPMVNDTELRLGDEPIIRPSSVARLVDEHRVTLGCLLLDHVGSSDRHRPPPNAAKS